MDGLVDLADMVINDDGDDVFSPWTAVVCLFPPCQRLVSAYCVE